jgi:hypothetical protein
MLCISLYNGAIQHTLIYNVILCPWLFLVALVPHCVFVASLEHSLWKINKIVFLSESLHHLALRFSNILKIWAAMALQVLK